MIERAATRREERFARLYPRVMAWSEQAGQAAMRSELLAHARGRTLDLGTGNGFSVPHYPPAVSELVMLEPNPALRDQLQSVVPRIRARAWRIVDGDAYDLPFEDGSLDTVAAGLVFCSLTEPRRALDEVHRVLQPGGQFLFHEHVRGGGVRRVLQELTTPLQVRLADGCHPNRDFVGMLEESPFEVTRLTRTRMPRAFVTVVPMVLGIATKTP